MKIKASKKNNFYIQNVYANQMLKSKKQNAVNNAYSENTRKTTDYTINQNVNFNPKKIYFNKKTIYHNHYQNKSNANRGNHNLLSQIKIHNKSIKKYNPNLSVGLITDSVISRRKTKNNYEILNPFKQRSNSENKLNSFNRTYVYFNNKDNIQMSLYKTNPNHKNKKENKNIERISINLNDISHQNIKTKLYNFDNSIENLSYNIKKNITPIKNKNTGKSYYYQEKILKKNNLKWILMLVVDQCTDKLLHRE